MLKITCEGVEKGKECPILKAYRIETDGKNNMLSIKISIDAYLIPRLTTREEVYFDELMSAAVQKLCAAYQEYKSKGCRREYE